MAQAFVTYWVFVYGPLVQSLSDNRSQFASKFFQDVCSILDIRNMFVMTYHRQGNGQVKGSNRTMLNALISYIADDPKEWDMYTEANKYAYTT